MLEAELVALLEQTADAAYMVTESGVICSWNEAAERLFGYPKAEALGGRIDDLFEARDALGTPALAGGSEAMTRRWDGGSGGIPNFDLEVRTRSGRRMWVNVSTIIFDNRRTGHRLFVRLARDVDQRRRNEELLRRMVEAARQLVAEADGTTRHARVSPLSEQELRILNLLAGGASSRTIVRELNISANTLRNHLHHINVKLRTTSRLEAGSVLLLAAAPPDTPREQQGAFWRRLSRRSPAGSTSGLLPSA
jgi:PAS domain S-box-containing protein